MATRGAKKQRCGPGPSATVSLPVVDPKTGIRKSKSGRRRAIVLVIVQLLMIAHIVQWALSGTTLTPIEPSESMEFTKRGVINAGLLFFLAALLATLVFGRWFCGWGCHIVMLQDGCGWLMKKVGVRPKPFRSRLLAYVPLILALYMFIWPAFYRLAIAPFAPELREAVASLPGWLQIILPVTPDLAPWQAESHLTTSSFWQTFPPWWIAIPFLAICGLATVYFLGAKGFCTYGCPYGGFFAPLDELSPARIRVTDDCEQCGHCTAVCTSNVRVHEEVHEFGMVVDSGCMKCLDCVSVCPNDALYFGMGRPAIGKGKPRDRGIKPLHDLTWSEEIGLAVVFLVAFYCVRGAYGLVPMLLAAGTAACLTFIAWKLWGLARKPNVNLYRFQLKYKGRVTRSGFVYAALALLIGLIVVHTGTVKALLGIAEHFGRRAMRSPMVVYAPAPPPMSESQRADADRALAIYDLLRGADQGGFGLPTWIAFGHPLAWHVELDTRRSRLYADALSFGEAEQILQGLIDRAGPSDNLCTSLAWVIHAQDPARAWTFSRAMLLNEPGMSQLLADVISRAALDGRMPAVVELCAERLERYPDDRSTLQWMARFRLESGEADESLSLIRRYIALAPDDSGGYLQMGQSLGALGRLDEALASIERAYELAPDDVQVNMNMAAVLEALGRVEDAARFRSDAARLRQSTHAGSH